MQTYIYEALPETSYGTEETRNEDCTPSSEPVVEGRSQPTTNERTAHVWGTIDKTGEPCASRIPRACCLASGEVFSFWSMTCISLVIVEVM